MKSLLIGFVIVLGVAQFVNPPSKKEMYERSNKRSTSILANEEYATKTYTLHCVMCDKEWETEDWANEPGPLSPFSYQSEIILFCSMSCRNQWQLTRKVK